MQIAALKIVAWIYGRFGLFSFFSAFEAWCHLQYGLWEPGAGLEAGSRCSGANGWCEKTTGVDPPRASINEPLRSFSLTSMSIHRDKPLTSMVTLPHFTVLAASSFSSPSKWCHASRVGLLAQPKTSIDIVGTAKTCSTLNALWGTKAGEEERTQNFNKLASPSSAGATRDVIQLIDSIVLCFKHPSGTKKSNKIVNIRWNRTSRRRQNLFSFST